LAKIKNSEHEKETTAIAKTPEGYRVVALDWWTRSIACQVYIKVVCVGMSC